MTGLARSPKSLSISAKPYARRLVKGIAFGCSSSVIYFAAIPYVDNITRHSRKPNRRLLELIAAALARVQFA